MTVLFGCQLTPVADAGCRRVLRSLREPMEIAEANPCRWLLAHCDDGVVWGRRDSASDPWRLSGDVFPDISPTPRDDTVQQLRLFGDASELLIWRQAAGFRGRWLTDAPLDSPGGALAPFTERQVLLGSRIVRPTQDGFTLVADATGSRHAAPVACSDAHFRHRLPLRLEVRHYLTRDEVSGAVRIAGSRLVRVFNSAALEEQRS